MMSEGSPTYDLLSRGRAAAKAGDIAEARRYLERCLDLGPPIDERMEGLYWLSEVSTDPKERRVCLEEILANNFGDARARRKLAILDGKLKEGDIIDADHIPAPRPDASPEAVARSFTCPKCGGKRVFAPDGQTLVCEYCEVQEQISSHKTSSDPNDDFVVAMATAKAQRKPVTARTLTCKGCGSTFFLPPEIITRACPYCATPYAIEQIEMRDLDAPDGIIPFAVDENHARAVLKSWFLQNPMDGQPKVARGLGIYLPVWIFTMGGQIDWSARVYKNERWIPVSGVRVVGEEQLIVPASHRLPADLLANYSQYNLTGILPFDLRYLTNWSAETFQVSAADASLDARKQAIDRIRSAIEIAEMDQRFDSFQIHSANMLVASYRLVLLPVWLSSYLLNERRYELVINGQSGKVLGQKAHQGLSGWLRNIL
jgi:hypothetical protein